MLDCDVVDHLLICGFKFKSRVDKFRFLGQLSFSISVCRPDLPVSFGIKRNSSLG